MRKAGSGGIVKISDLFKVYADRLRAPQKTVVSTFIEVIEDLFHIQIRAEQCNYSVATKTLTVHTFGPLKSEIIVHKKEILAHLKGRLGEKSTPKEIL